MTTAVVWDDRLITKYNLSGPRYTSYPTALEFADSFSRQQRVTAWQESTAKRLALYLHIPFCHTLCYYCGCNKVITRHPEKADRYLEQLAVELRGLPPEMFNKPVALLHLGGGTPSFLSTVQLQRLMALLRQHFQFQDDAECSLELDPRHLEPDYLEQLRGMGFNRLSIGVQDFNDKVQRTVNRVQDEAFIHELVHQARTLDFRSVNLDLIYGLPFQTPETFAETLSKTMALRPDRLSVFNYAHLPQRFAAQRKLDGPALPSAATKLTLLRQSIATCTEAGYQFIGMDHFALPEDSLAVAQRNGVLHRNFQGYTTHGDCDLLGLGVSAISQIGNCFAQNHHQLNQYYAQLEQQGHGLAKGVVLTVDDQLRGDVIKQLICHFRLVKADIEQRWQIDFDQYFAEALSQLAPLADDGLLELGDTLRVTPAGRLLIRNICMVFDAYLPKYRQQQKFSRVI